MAEIDVGHGAASHDAADEVDNRVCNKQGPVGVGEVARIRNIGDLYVVSAEHVGKTLRLGGRIRRRAGVLKKKAHRMAMGFSQIVRLNMQPNIQPSKLMLGLIRLF